ncbi:Competence protein CoiA-like family protein [Mucilaginibacter pineti]|uniref:Competence protein CoiA-like family protein n=1 Tax=Mucilaginibacter pineti TaxID=1391627 RepID=A0A1G6ZDQ0_9SPHI|nr:competence protein CoiA family protein [Mucilaginibacter pineti]SDE00015.1 Competence protein CoiA-like family protein [Mucilaginibacter pineti]
MIRYANVNGEIRVPETGLKGYCPGCGNPVTAKCGFIKIHHWAHLKHMDCDRWWEPMTQWHLDWQDNFPKEWREKIFRNEITGEFHRADIQTPEGITIEFQHSHLSTGELLSRNNFYKKLIWVINAQSFKNNIRLNAAIPNPRSSIMDPFNFSVSYEGLASSPQYFVKDDLQHGPLVYSKGLNTEQLKAIADCQESGAETYWLFNWSYKHRSWLNSEAPVFLDFGEDTLYWIRKRPQVGTSLIYLQCIKKRDFIAKYAVNEVFERTSNNDSKD